MERLLPTPELICLDGRVPIHTAAEKLRDTLGRLHAREPMLFRIEQRVDPTDAAAWLEAQDRSQQFYWRDRDGDRTVAGTGIALDVSGDGFGALRDAFDLDADQLGLRLFATGRFDLARAPDDAWSPFGRARMLLPEIELRCDGGDARLGCHWLAGPGRDVDHERLLGRLARVRAPGEAAETALPQCRSGASDQTQWAENVERVLREIDAARLEKAVLARRTVFTADAALPPARVLRELSANRPGTFGFCIQLARDLAFVGVSPELLYRRRGRAIESDALAGTRPRGAGEEQDRKLTHELQNSDKDRREHQLVRAHIEGQLAPLCDQLESRPAPSVEKLPYVQHLRSVFRGVLARGVHDGAVLDRLHPTPAVCGHPIAAARTWITNCEGFDRGLYGGMVGCLGRERADCAVAIRSALVRGRELTVFAGAGIVAGSDASSEWDETVDKMRAFAPVLESP